MKHGIVTVVAALFAPFALFPATYYASPDGTGTGTADSPCRNAGVNEDWMVGACGLLGRPRIVNSRVDIGCYESLGRGMRISIK